MTSKLTWDYQDHARLPEYRASYKGLTLIARHDESPANPFEEHDGHWPMMVYLGRDGFTSYDPDVSEVLSRFTDAQLVHDQKAVARILVWDGVMASTYNVKYVRDGELLRNEFEQALDEVRDSDKLETLAALYALLDIPALCTTVNGYCQGHWAEVLVVATPEAQKEFGTTVELVPADLQAQADLYAAWAYGDVYGYLVCDPEGEEIDACWGYYGADFAESGLEDAAIEAADWQIDEKRKARLAVLKKMIKGKVPLWVRPDALANA